MKFTGMVMCCVCSFLLHPLVVKGDQDNCPTMDPLITCVQFDRQTIDKSIGPCSYRCYPKYQHYAYGHCGVSFVMNVTSSNQVSCQWSHNGTQITRSESSPYRISGMHYGTLTFKNPLTYYYLGDYIINCTDDDTGNTSQVIVRLLDDDIGRRVFSPTTDKPYIDEDTYHSDASPLLIDPQQPITLGPIRVKYVTQGFLFTQWCSLSSNCCCSQSSCVDAVSCNGCLSGWTSSCQLSKYTGYMHFYLKRERGDSSVREFVFEVVDSHSEMVLENRTISLTTGMTVQACSGLSHPVYAGSVVGGFFVGCLFAGILMLVVMCLVMECRIRKLREKYQQEPSVIVNNDDYQEYLDNVIPRQPAGIQADVRRHTGSYSNNMEDDLILTVDEGEKV